MSVNATRTQVLALYKSLLRESQKFPSYNFRTYALRRVRDAFKENKSLTEVKDINIQMDFAKENLNIIKRQTIIGDMFRTERLVIENVR